MDTFSMDKMAVETMMRAKGEGRSSMRDWLARRLVLIGWVVGGYLVGSKVIDSKLVGSKLVGSRTE
jgi:hypothetical protein